MLMDSSAIPPTNLRRQRQRRDELLSVLPTHGGEDGVGQQRCGTDLWVAGCVGRGCFWRAGWCLRGACCVFHVLMCRSCSHEPQMRGRLSSFSILCKRFASIMRHCDVESFLTIGRVYQEIAPMERRVDIHVDTLRREEFRVVECVNDVAK